MEKIIKIEHLFKSFGNVKAVNDLSFSVREGELFAFLGVNGAGKSTTISMMCGQLLQDSGKIEICGKDTCASMADIFSRIGVVFQNSVLDPFLTVRENLESRAAMYGISGRKFDSRLNELASLLSFENILGRQFGKLSGGQKRRIDIARSLFHNPDILFLDEPTTGLDPQTRKILWDVVTELRRGQNMTVLLTTHYMEEAADADYVVIIDSGRVSAEGTPLELKNRYTGDFVLIYTDDENFVSSLGFPYQRLRDSFRISVPNCAEATRMIVHNQDKFVDYEITKGKMDDVFLSVTGKKLTVGDENDNVIRSYKKKL